LWFRQEFLHFVSSSSKAACIPSLTIEQIAISYELTALNADAELLAIKFSQAVE
jgi:hypothetical protein